MRICEFGIPNFSDNIVISSDLEQYRQLCLIAPRNDHVGATLPLADHCIRDNRIRGTQRRHCCKRE